MSGRRVSGQQILGSLLAVALAALIGGSSAQAQNARTSPNDALNAFPCPSGDASCGNGSPASAATRSPPINGLVPHEKAQNRAPQNAEPDSNPDQKIEDAGPGDVDQGVTNDLQEMQREAQPHDVNQPK